MVWGLGEKNPRLPDYKGTTMTIITLHDQLDAAERELSRRRAMYPELVRIGKQSQEKADYEITLMDAICGTLRLRIEEKGK